MWREIPLFVVAPISQAGGYRNKTGWRQVRLALRSVSPLSCRTVSPGDMLYVPARTLARLITSLSRLDPRCCITSAWLLTTCNPIASAESSPVNRHSLCIVRNCPVVIVYDEHESQISAHKRLKRIIGTRARH